MTIGNVIEFNAGLLFTFRWLSKGNRTVPTIENVFSRVSTVSSSNFIHSFISKMDGNFKPVAIVNSTIKGALELSLKKDPNGWCLKLKESGLLTHQFHSTTYRKIIRKSTLSLDDFSLD